MTDLDTRLHEDEAYRWARKRAEAIQGLYTHLIVYVVVILGLFGINLLTRGDEGPWWFFWPALGWGVGLLIHLLSIAAPVFSPEWADRRARRMLERGERPESREESAGLDAGDDRSG